MTEKGVLYFAAAGNDNLINAAGRRHRLLGSAEIPRRRDLQRPRSTRRSARGLAEEGLGPYEPDCMDYDPGAGVDTEFGITVEPGRALSLNLQWAEPWFGVKTALFALPRRRAPAAKNRSSTGQGTPTCPMRPQIRHGMEKPERRPAQAARLVIARCAGAKCNPKASATANPPIKIAITQDGSGVSEIEYPKSAGGDIVGPVILGHRGSPYVTTVGAVNFQESSTAPKAPEPYSSRGPVTHYFGPVTGTTPAAPLGSPEVISKPDITATDCASNTFFGILAKDGWHFCGSSQAAEHAATIAALMRQTAPLATPGENPLGPGEPRRRNSPRSPRPMRSAPGW